MRKVYRAKRGAIDENTKALIDAELCRRVTSCDAYISAEVVLAYYPIKNEPDVLLIVKDALSKGKRVAFPISDPENFELDFRYVSSLEDMVCGEYSIPEPEPTAERFLNDASSKALCIVPGLSFDRNGFRIGYGKGFYDRFLSRFEGVSVGLLAHGLLADELPRENTDMAVDVIITEKEEIFTYGKRE